MVKDSQTLEIITFLLVNQTHSNLMIFSLDFLSLRMKLRSYIRLIDASDHNILANTVATDPRLEPPKGGLK